MRATPCDTYLDSVTIDAEFCGIPALPHSSGCGVVTVTGLWSRPGVELLFHRVNRHGFAPHKNGLRDDDSEPCRFEGGPRGDAGFGVQAMHIDGEGLLFNVLK